LRRESPIWQTGATQDTLQPVARHSNERVGGAGGAVLSLSCPILLLAMTTACHAGAGERGDDLAKRAQRVVEQRAGRRPGGWRGHATLFDGSRGDPAPLRSAADPACPGTAPGRTRRAWLSA